MIPERGSQKSVVLIETQGIVIDSMGNDGTHACDLRHVKASPYRVGQEIGPQPFALKLTVDGQPADEQQWHPIGHVLP